MLETRKIFGNIAQRCDEIVPSSDSIAIESDEGLYRVVRPVSSVFLEEYSNLCVRSQALM